MQLDAANCRAMLLAWVAETAVRAQAYRMLCTRAGLPLVLQMISASRSCIDNMV